MPDHRRAPRRIALAGAAVLIAGVNTSAQSASPDSAQEPSAGDAPLFNETQPRPWTIQFEPSVWYAALGGDLRLRNGRRINMDDRAADDPQASPAGELHIRADDLTFTLSGFGFRVDDRAGPPGELESEIRLASFDATLGFKVWDWRPRIENDTPSNVLLCLNVYAGARFFHMDVRETIDAVRTDADGAWVHPLVGAKLEMELTRRFSADLALDAGAIPFGSRESYSVSVMVGFQWRPHDNVGVQIGFRQMFFNLEDNDIDFDGSLGGLIGSVVVRF